MATHETDAEPMRNHNGSVMLNDKAQVVYRSQFLSTHPLKQDCKERIGTGGKILTYMTGDGVIRTMNAVFGYGGWGTEITRERQVACQKDAQGKWTVGYMATVRMSLKQSGVSHEDCGFGESTHESKLKALDTAMKSAITDAMKRAARHFGERLGNALYVSGSGMQSAPKDNKAALNDLERQEALDLFGDQQALSELRAMKSKTLEHKSPSESERPTGAAASGGDRQRDSATVHRPSSGEARLVSLPKESYLTPAEHGRGTILTPPDYTRGFTKASDLAGMVTPQNSHGSQLAGRVLPQQGAVVPSPATSPNAKPVGVPTSNKHGRNSPPSLNVGHGKGAPVSEAALQSVKRQKVTHNPYQR